jgi:glycerol kinase
MRWVWYEATWLDTRREERAGCPVERADTADRSHFRRQVHRIYENVTLSPTQSSGENRPQYFPKSGWVEHDPMDLWRTTEETIRGALADAGLSAKDISAIGITNQRETVVVWDRDTGKPVHNAIVWQDRRTASSATSSRRQGSRRRSRQDRFAARSRISPAPSCPGCWPM